MSHNTLRDGQLHTLWISRIDYQENSGVNTHSHEDFYQIILIMDGAGTIQIGDKTYSIGPKQFYFIPRGIEHNFLFSSESTTIDFKFQIICPELNRLIENICIEEAVMNEHLMKELKEIFKLTVENLHHPDPILLYRIDVNLKGMILQLLESYSMNKKSTSSTFSVPQEIHPDIPIVEYLREHIQSRITLEDIAKHFNFHPHYLIEVFRKKLGTTPMQLLQKIRIEKSKEYLEFTNTTVTEIAEQVGLTAPYFSRLFREREGISPTEYREQSINVIGQDMILEKDFILEIQPAVNKSERSTED